MKVFLLAVTAGLIIGGAAGILIGVSSEQYVKNMTKSTGKLKRRKEVK